MNPFLNWSVASQERLCDCVEHGPQLRARTNAEIADLVEEHMLFYLSILTPGWALLDEVIDRLRRDQTA